MNAQPQAYGKLEVRAGYFPLQWGFMFMKPKIEIDGQPHVGKWGSNVFDLPAGQHQLRVSAPGMIFRNLGAATYQPTIHPGHVTVIDYYAGFFVFLAGGTIKELQGHPIAQLPPGR